MSLCKEKIGDVCIVGDGVHASIKRTIGGIPYLTSKNFKKEGLDLNKLDYISEDDYRKHFRDNSKAITKPKIDDVLLSIIGSIGAPYYVNSNEEFGLSSSVSILRPKQKKVKSKYLYYWIKSDTFQSAVHNIKSGVAQSFLSLSMIRDLPILYPVNKDVQQKIASILSAYDDLIKNNLKRIKLLEEAAQNIYKEWFVNFRFPGYEGVEFGEDGMPEGWDIVELGEIIKKLESGGRPKGGIDKNLKVGVPSIGAENVIGLGKYNFSKEKIIPLDYYEKMKKGKLENKDILIYKDGAYIGKTTLFQDDFPHPICAVNEHVFLVQANSNVYQYYLFFMLNTKDYFNKMRNLNSNAAQPGINQTKIKTLELNLPTKRTTVCFNSKIENMVRQIFVLAKQNKALKEARDILLPRLMDRRIEV